MEAFIYVQESIKGRKGPVRVENKKYQFRRGWAAQQLLRAYPLPAEALRQGSFHGTAVLDSLKSKKALPLSSDSSSSRKSDLLFASHPIFAYRICLTHTDWTKVK
jgi:hypothetical protein